MNQKIALADLPQVGTDRQGHRWTPARELRARLHAVTRVLNAAETLHRFDLIHTEQFDAICETLNHRVTIEL